MSSILSNATKKSTVLSRAVLPQKYPKRDRDRDASDIEIDIVEVCVEIYNIDV